MFSFKNMHAPDLSSTCCVSIIKGMVTFLLLTIQILKVIKRCGRCTAFLIHCIMCAGVRHGGVSQSVFIENNLTQGDIETPVELNVPRTVALRRLLSITTRPTCRLCLDYFHSYIYVSNYRANSTFTYFTSVRCIAVCTKALKTFI